MAAESETVSVVTATVPDNASFRVYWRRATVTTGGRAPLKA
ncbi:hypothetical protein [Haloarcula amylovorans]|nr:hypothetical protein [Halomicroarcula amylolytica]